FARLFRADKGCPFGQGERAAIGDRRRRIEDHIAQKEELIFTGKKDLTLEPYALGERQLQFEIVAIIIGIPAQLFPITSRLDRLAADFDLKIPSSAQDDPGS